MLITREYVYAALDAERLYHFLTQYMSIKMKQNKEEMEFTLATPATTAHNWWKITVEGWEIAVDEGAVQWFIDKVNNEAGTYENYCALRDVINSPSDKTVILSPAVKVILTGDEPPLFSDNTLLYHFSHVDDKLEKLYNYIESEFGFIARQLTKAAELYGKDVSRDKTHDIYLGFGANDDPTEEVSFFLNIKKIPYHLPCGRDHQAIPLPLTDDDKQALFGYDDIRQNIDAAIGRLNKTVREFTLLGEGHVGFEKTYVWNKVYDVIVPSILVIHLEPFALFGGYLGDVDKIESEEVNNIRQAADAFVTSLFAHLRAIPPMGDGFDHYALDTHSMKIFARNVRHEIIGEVTDPQYRFDEVIEPYYSEGFMVFAKRHIEGIKNKHIFFKLGKIVRKPVEGEVSSDKASTQKMETGQPITLH